MRRWIVTFTDMDDPTRVLKQVRAWTRLGAQAMALKRPTMFCFTNISRSRWGLRERAVSVS
jgi:hypothetical protein